MSEWIFTMKDLSCFEVFHTFEDGDSRDMRGELELLDVLNERLSQYRKQYDAQQSELCAKIILTHNLQAELSALKKEVEGGVRVYGELHFDGSTWSEKAFDDDTQEALLIRVKPIGENE